MYRFVFHVATSLALVASVATVSIAAPSTANADSTKRTWGAIAYNPVNGAYGVAYNYRKRTAAQKEAFKRCKQVLCNSLVSFRGGCAAVAAERRAVEQFGTGKVTFRYSGTYGYSRAKTKQAAIDRAMAQCKKRAMEFCRLRVWVCTR